MDSASPKPTVPRRLEQNLGLAAVGLLLLGCLVVLRPFYSGLVWAVVLCFSTWPFYRRLLAALRDRRTLAAFVMCLGLVVVLILPFVVIGVTMADSARELGSATRAWLREGLPSPPTWVRALPLVGAPVDEYWRSVSHDGAKLLGDAERFVEPVLTGLVKSGLLLGRGVLEIAVSIFVAFFLYRDGAAVAGRLTTGAVRLAGDRGRHLLEVAGQTIRGVLYGILGTALVQAVLAGTGFAIAGVPGAALLAFLTFFLSVVPAGPPLIWIPSAFWLFHRDETGWGIFMVVWGIGVSSIDNLVRPWLISQGSAQPFVLVFFGVVGGVLAFGFIGVFLGPILLAVGYRLIEEWIALSRRAAGT